jgi:hypothetical protein
MAELTSVMADFGDRLKKVEDSQKIPRLTTQDDTAAKMNLDLEDSKEKISRPTETTTKSRRTVMIKV